MPVPSSVRSANAAARRQRRRHALCLRGEELFHGAHSILYCSKTVSRCREAAVQPGEAVLQGLEAALQVANFSGQ
jgi:hypothetical protein